MNRREYIAVISGAGSLLSGCIDELQRREEHVILTDSFFIDESFSEYNVEGYSGIGNILETRYNHKESEIDIEETICLLIPIPISRASLIEILQQPEIDIEELSANPDYTYTIEHGIVRATSVGPAEVHDFFYQGDTLTIAVISTVSNQHLERYQSAINSIQHPSLE